MPSGESVTEYLRKLKQLRKQRAPVSGATSAPATASSASTSPACTQCHGPTKSTPGFVPRACCATCFANRLRAGQQSTVPPNAPSDHQRDLQRDMQATRARIFVRLARGDWEAQVAPSSSQAVITVCDHRCCSTGTSHPP
jgi:galactose-1-phosphate uridylyltransferase